MNSNLRWMAARRAVGNARSDSHRKAVGLRSTAIILATLMLIGGSIAWADYKQVNKPNPDDPMDVQIYRLDNGLTVYLTQNRETPRFYAEIAVRAGSKHDPAETTGLAHYLEHLLFKGNREMGTLDYEAESGYLERITELYERHFVEEDPGERAAIYQEINRIAQGASQYAIPNEIDKLYKAMGGTALNAHTWHEETVYKVSLPSNRLEQWAIIESNRFIDPIFRLFHTELETVYEEKNRSLDNKSRVINEAVNMTLFKNHPYGQQPTIGSVQHLKRPSLKTIYDFYNTYYIPNNMAICISGNIDITTAIKLIDAQFSKWTPGKLPRQKKWREKRLAGVERVEVEYPGEEYVLLAYRTARKGHKDEEALRLLDMTLDNSAAGLININLNQRQRVRQAGSFPYTLNDYGTQYLWGIPKDQQSLEEVEALLLEQLEILKRGEFEDWISPAIITDFKKTEKAQLESDAARVAAMRSSFLAYEDWNHAVDTISRMGRVSKKDIVRVAKKYFGRGYVVGHRLDGPQEIPSIEKPLIDPVHIDPTRQSEFAREVLELPTTALEPVYIDPNKDYTIVDASPGTRVYYVPNPLNDLFSFSIHVEIGSYEDNRIRVATRLLDKSGAGEFSAEDLKKEWYKLGTNFGVGAGDNETSISMSGLDENFEGSLGLMIKVITEPKAPNETLDQMKQIILAQREDSKKDPGTIGAALTNYNRYGKESSYLRVLPAAMLKELTSEELFDIIRGLLSYKRTITYTGSMPLDQLVTAVNTYLPPSDDLKDPPPYHFRQARRPEQTEIYFFNKEMAQAQVRIEFSDGIFNEDDNTGVQLYNSYFAGGMSGIVFQELREARALAYSAAARYITGSRKNDENLMVGVIGCQADKTPDALDAFIKLFDNLPRSEERFAETLNSLDNRYRSSKTGFRGVIGSVRSWERLGVGVDPRKKRFEGLIAADIDSLMEFQQKHIRNRPKLISIVGDRSRIDMDAIGAHGKIVVVDAEDIFVD